MSEGEAKAKAKGIMKHNGHAMKKVVHMVIEQGMTPEFGYIGKGDKQGMTQAMKEALAHLIRVSIVLPP